MDPHQFLLGCRQVTALPPLLLPLPLRLRRLMRLRLRRLRLLLHSEAMDGVDQAAHRLLWAH